VKLYWSYNSIPELADLPKEKRKVVWKSCHLKVFQHWLTWFSFLISGICVAAGIALGDFYYGRMGGIIGGAIAGGIGGFIAWEIKVAKVRPYIREYLNTYEQTNQQSL
jgi:hypothetical protein